jgi:VIT1/CCC1 family predicted Fe2+/Mn2+ transporter
MSLFERLSVYWQDSLTLLLGVALFLTPWFFGFEALTAAALNAHLVGAVLMIMGLLALFAFQRWEDWVSGLLGAWLFISPWFLGFSASMAPTVTHIVAGIAAVVLAIWSINEHEAGLPAGR